MRPSFNVRQQSEIYIGSVAEILPGVLPTGRVVVVSDATIDRFYHPLLAPYDTILIGSGESAKTLQGVEMVYHRLIELGVDRSTFVLAVGGGIVTDVAGFAASTYMRGLRFGFISTTLLGQVDASVGGKNGVNVEGYKNMVGTFSQPQFVICDPHLLVTLPDREFRAGLSELIKAAIIADAELFERIEHTTFEALRTDADLLADAVSAAIRVKADIVEYDERETGARRKLNLGHTLAHAIEKCSSRMNHGEAVAVGIALIAGAAVRLGVLTPSDRDRIVALLSRLGFDLTPPVEMSHLLREVTKDKKKEGDRLHIVLPVGIGDCEVRTMTIEDFAALFSA
ncbi:MAG: 3-dehydroquinate synthase [Alistipes sp.]